MVKPLLILSDLHHRISGVSASIRSLIPQLHERYQLIFIAKQDHALVKGQSLMQLFQLLRRWRNSDNPVWHVRRNNEMLYGLIFRTFVCARLKLIFTSAAIRRHSAWPRYLISKMDAVIATSTKAASFVPNVKAVVPHGVDITHFENVAALTKQSWLEYQTVIAIVGRVRPEKGTDIFSNAIARLLIKHPEACALVVGKTTAKFQSFKLSLQQQWQKAGIADRVFILDEVPLNEMPSLYASVDIVCAPARYEGFGLVPLEAMVSGTAIIAAKTGAYEDIVEHEVSGLLVDCADQRQFTEALAELLSQPTKVERFKAAGKAIVRQRFSLQNEVAGNCDIYEQMRTL